MGALDELKKLLMQKQAEKQAAAIPTPQNPVNYNENNAEGDQTEFKDADVDQSDRAIIDEPEAETEEGLPQEVEQGDVAKPDDNADENMPLASDDDSLDKELASSKIGDDKDRSPASDEDDDNGSDTDEFDTAKQLTPQELEGASPKESADVAASPSDKAKLNPQAQYYSDLMSRLKAAQDKGNLNSNLNDAGKYAYAAGTSFRGVQKDPLIMKTMEEEGQRAQLPVQQFIQQLQVEGQDPNSQAAQSMRTVYAQTLGIDPSKLANMNIDQMEKTFGFLGKNATDKIKAQAAVMNAQSKQGQLALNQKKQADQLPLTQSQIDKNNAATTYLGQKPDLEKARIAAMKDQKAKADAEKQKSSDEKEIAKAAKELNGLSASSRSVIGSAERIKAGGQRMLGILNDPNATPQDMQAAAADMNSMISGNPTVSGTDHLAYNNLQNEFSKAIQFITSSPDAPNIPEIKQHMKDVANKIMALSDKIQEKQAGRVFAGRKDLFDRRPDSKQAILDSLKDIPTESPTAQANGSYDGSSTLPPNATPDQKAARLKYLQTKAGQ